MKRLMKRRTLAEAPQAVDVGNERHSFFAFRSLSSKRRP